jgi:hypothetical protein
MFAVDDIDETLEKLRKRGPQLVAGWRKLDGAKRTFKSPSPNDSAKGAGR